MYSKGDEIRFRTEDGKKMGGEVLGFYNNYIVKEPSGRVVIVKDKDIEDDNRKEV